MRAVEPRIVKPFNCTDDEIALFCKLVEQGGEVERRGLTQRVMRAKTLVFLSVDQTVVGIAGLKHPVLSYRDGVFRKAGVPNIARAFDLELGWVYIPKSQRRRGYSLVLSSAAMTQSDGAAVFATIRADNIAMQRTTQKLGFRRVGDSWASQREGHNRLVLFVSSK